MLTFEIPAVKCHHGVEVNWPQYRDTGVADPALVKYHFESYSIYGDIVLSINIYVYTF